MRGRLDAYRCSKCRNVFVNMLAVRLEDGTVRCPECNSVVDYTKCCKTCANWSCGCTYFGLYVEDGDTACDQSNAVVEKLLDYEKGPPWPDCRGWKGKKQSTE